jgi:hypothetical protein
LIRAFFESSLVAFITSIRALSVLWLQKEGSSPR